MYHVGILPLSMTMGALGPISIATAPAPPVGRALPEAYTAMSAATALKRNVLQEKKKNLKTGKQRK